MKKITDSLQQQTILFLLGLAIFIVMAAFGWEKLHYGINFIDEGMYMTDGWRLTAGDHLFPDSSISVTLLYALFNAGIFKLFPDISLLGFRELQYVLTMLAILTLGLSVARWSGRYWFIPYAMSIFAFTGLDANGMSANMSYYTYPHLFFTLHIACLLFALSSSDRLLRPGLLILSGVFLWGIGFSLLPLSLGMLYPILLWGLAKWLDLPAIRLTLRDLLYLLGPGVILWLTLLAVYNVAFFQAMADVYRYTSESGGTEFHINSLALQYIGITGGYLFVLFLALRYAGKWVLAALAAASTAMYLVMDTNLFGLVTLYWRGWFATQMWFNALLIAFMIAFFLYVLVVGRNRPLDKDEQGLLATLIPGAIFAGLFAQFSSLGALTAAFVSIPIMLALVFMLVKWLERGAIRAHYVSALAILIVCLPYYYKLARADWQFTYFDLTPHMLTEVIPDGFGAGIHTNGLYRPMAEWMQESADRYSSKDDFALILDQTPMGYMLTKRRPALNHSWTGWGNSSSLRKDAIELMKREKRFPKIAFKFVVPPIFFPVSIEDETFGLSRGKTFDPNDPISHYIYTHMRLMGRFRANGRAFVELYVDDDPGKQDSQ